MAGKNGLAFRRPGLKFERQTYVTGRKVLNPTTPGTQFNVKVFDLKNGKSPGRRDRKKAGNCSGPHQKKDH